jgi:site-specific recombinase XerD
MTPLRQRFIDDLRLRNYSPKTVHAYVAGVVGFAQHFGRSPAELGTEDIRTYQLHLLQRGATWSVYDQTACAVRFLYGVTLGRADVVHVIPYGKRPKTLPAVLSPEEVTPTHRDRGARPPPRKCADSLRLRQDVRELRRDGPVRIDERPRETIAMCRKRHNW